MKKNLYLTVVALVLANVAVTIFSCNRDSNTNGKASDPISHTMEKELHTEVALYQAKSDSLYHVTVYQEGHTPNCYSGGYNSGNCKIGPGININGKGDLSSGCAVTCELGFYACCSYECHCIPATKWE